MTTSGAGVRGDARDELLWRTERWFVRRGVPHLIDDYSARTDIFTRAFPVLVLVLLAELGEPIRDEAPWWFNTLVLLAGVAAVVGGLVLVNRLRGRPALRRPESIGAVELTVWVVLGPLVQAAFGEAANAARTLGSNLVLLVVIYVVTSYGLIPMTRWAVGQLGRQLLDVANLMIRSLPLLLVFTMFMFLNNEMWQVADDVPTLWFAAACGLLVAVGSLFLVLRLSRETEGLRHFGSWPEVAELVADTPVADAVPDADGVPEPPALSRRARVNLGLNLFVSQGIQIGFVALAIGAFYGLFGLLVVSPETVATWTGTDAVDPLVTWSVAGEQLVVTEPLVLVCIFVAAIAGLQFTVSALTDDAYREEFTSDLLRALRTDLAVRAVYLRLLP